MDLLVLVCSVLLLILLVVLAWKMLDVQVLLPLCHMLGALFGAGGGLMGLGPP